MLLTAPNPSRVRTIQKTTTLNVANTTGSIVLATITGSVFIRRIWGEVTTVLSSNVTAAHLRTDDQTAQVDVTLNTGVALSAAAVGSMIWRAGLVTAALVLDSNAAGAIQDAQTAGNDFLTGIAIIKKTGATTTLDFRYTTTNNPSSGAIRWTIEWEPLSADGNIT